MYTLSDTLNAHTVAYTCINAKEETLTQMLRALKQDVIEIEAPNGVKERFTMVQYWPGILRPRTSVA